MQPAFLALGDSYTIGEGVMAAERWPSQLVTRLRGEGIDVGEPKIVARTGWTTSELLEALDAAACDPCYALTTLLVGVNNQYRERPLDEYRWQFRALLKRAIVLSGGEASRVVVVSIPDWSVTPFAHNEGRDTSKVPAQIDGFNEAARAEVGTLGAHWVNVTAISRVAHRRIDLVADGLHPSGAQYARWVEAILPTARALLRMT